MTIQPIAYFSSPLKEKFGTPRQAGLVPGMEGEIKFCEGFAPEMLEGLEDYDYIWLIWGFSLNREGAGHSPKVRPPRLGGNKKTGVFASRSPYRPNPLGLSSVKVASINAERGIIHVLGADLVDGTPVYDIKPYLEYADSHTGIRSGFSDSVPRKELDVKWSADALSSGLERHQIDVLSAILASDPRPAYQNDPERIYGLSYDCWNVRFRVEGCVAEVLSATRQSS